MRVLLLFVYVYLILYLIVNRRAREIINKYVHKKSSKLSKHINIRNLHIFYFFFCTSFRMENINFLYSIALWLSGFLSKFQVKLHSTPPPPPSQDLLQKEIRSSKSVYIPRWVAVETKDDLFGSLICDLLADFTFRMESHSPQLPWSASYAAYCQPLTAFPTIRSLRMSCRASSSYADCPSTGACRWWSFAKQPARVSSNVSVLLSSGNSKSPEDYPPLGATNPRHLHHTEWMSIVMRLPHVLCTFCRVVNVFARTLCPRIWCQWCRMWSTRIRAWPSSKKPPSSIPDTCTQSSHASSTRWIAVGAAR